MSFTPGNIVVYRVGSGSGTLTAAAAPVYLDEYTPAGVLVQSIAVATVDSGANQTLTAAGNATTEGMLTLSSDGHYLVLTGYDAAVGTAALAGTSSASVARVIGRVGADGVIDTTTTTTSYSGGTIRGAVSIDGTQFWETGSNGGVTYEVFGASVATGTIAATPANDRAINIFGGQLYVTSGSSPFVGVDSIGIGTPTTSGQTATLLTGTSSTNPYQFFFADLSTSVAGLDTLYVADNTSANGLEKFSLVGNSWVLNNKITLPTGMIGLTGSTSGSTASLFITTSSGIYSLTDSAGYNANDTGTATQIATAATNTAFRGIAFAPQALAAIPTLSIANASVAEGNGGTVALTFTVTASAAAPAGGITFTAASANGTATTADGDYTAINGSYTIAAGQTTTTVTVLVNGDTRVEGDETLTVTLSNPTGATIATAAATGTILDDDSAIVIPAGSFATTYTAGSAGSNYVLNAGGTRTVTANVVGVTVSANNASVDIEGTLTGFQTARAIDGSSGATGDTVLVGAAGTVTTANADAIRFRAVNGSYTISNLGQILVTNASAAPSVGGTSIGGGHGVVLTAVQGAAGAPATDYASGGTLTNGAAGATGALIRSSAGDAVRLGSHETLVNYGTIEGNGPINDSSANNGYRAAGSNSTATTYGLSRGVRIDDDGIAGSNQGKSDRIDNYGTIAGSQHGIDFGDPDAANSIVVNEVGGQIIGRNGSGVGADTIGAAATTITVQNSGLIRGDHAATVIDRAGYTYTNGTGDGDGDGVDIDGGATILNNAGATIAGTGAGGYDSNGRLNASEGISIGGGAITNAGTISGADAGIVVNNDANANGSRSGVTATTIVNNAAGTITGQASYAIRLENKTGTAADNDSIVNYGTITGNAAVPTGTVLRQDGSADAGTVGALDGVTYAAGDAGNARFIRGDGAAIQMGEGADTLANYGTITGNVSGRAINLEGGADTLTLYTGSTVTGRIDGGAGADTIVLRTDDRPVAGGGVIGNNSGATTGTLANVVNVEALDVASGGWSLTDAQGYAAGVTIESGARLTLATGAALTGAITDNGRLLAASTGTITLADAIGGGGVVEQAGSGTLLLAHAGNSYTGGTVLTAGTLDIGAQGAAGTGGIAFASGAQILRIEAAALNGGMFGNVITGFAADGDTLDVRGIGLATASYNNTTGILTLTGTSTEALTLGTGYNAYVFHTADDGAGGTAVTITAAPLPTLSISDPTVAEGNVGGTAVAPLYGDRERARAQRRHQLRHRDRRRHRDGRAAIMSRTL